MRLLHSSDVPAHKRQVTVEEPVFITCEADAHIVVALAMFLGRTQPDSTKRRNYYGLLSLLDIRSTTDILGNDSCVEYPYRLEEMAAVKTTMPFFYQCCPFCRNVYHTTIGATDYIVPTCGTCNDRLPTRHSYDNPLAHRWQAFTDPEIRILNTVLGKIHERNSLCRDAPYVKVAKSNKEVTNE